MAAPKKSFLQAGRSVSRLDWPRAIRGNLPLTLESK